MPTSGEKRKLGRFDYSKKWYSAITTNMSKLKSRECNLTGESIEDKAPEIRRYLMTRIMKTYLSLMCGATINKVQMYVYRRVVLLMQFVAIGRVGEAALSSWNRGKWLPDQQLLWMNWNEKKTGMQKPMTFNCDAKSFEMDIFHAFGNYYMFLATTTADNEGKNFLFPDLASKKLVASYLDTWLKDLIPLNTEEWTSNSALAPSMGREDTGPAHINGKVVGLFKDATLTSLRCGPVMECMCHPHVTERDINQRGGWTEDGGMKLVGNPPTRMSTYIRPSDYNVMRAGFALTGFMLPHSDGIAYAPKVSSFWDKGIRTPALALALKAELFQFPTEEFNSGSLREFGWTLLASQLMYFEPIIESYGSTHPVPRRILEAGIKVGLDFRTIKAWGKDVRELWNRENFPPIANRTLNYEKNAEDINRKLGELDVLKKQLAEQKDMLVTVIATLDKQADIVTEQELQGTNQQRTRTVPVAVTPAPLRLQPQPRLH